jgi:hypothetical protein
MYDTTFIPDKYCMQDTQKIAVPALPGQVQWLFQRP